MIAGNWKMFKTVEETVRFFESFRGLVGDVSHCEIIVAPPFPALGLAAQATKESNIRIAAQNVFWEDEGAYTGEVSASMLRAVGCQDVIIGHSERRQYFHETDKNVNRRVSGALRAGLRPIICVGETLEEREQEKSREVLLRQIDGALASLTAEIVSRIIVAYEPVWAIGTGRTATPDIAAEANRIIRTHVHQNFGDASEHLRILYGGSVKPDNIQGLMQRNDIDGALVGGAGLDPSLFSEIVHYPHAAEKPREP